MMRSECQMYYDNGLIKDIVEVNSEQGLSLLVYDELGQDSVITTDGQCGAPIQMH